MESGLGRPAFANVANAPYRTSNQFRCLRESRPSAARSAARARWWQGSTEADHLQVGPAGAAACRRDRLPESLRRPASDRHAMAVPGQGKRPEKQGSTKSHRSLTQKAPVPLRRGVATLHRSLGKVPARLPLPPFINQMSRSIACMAAKRTASLWSGSSILVGPACGSGRKLLAKLSRAVAAMASAGPDSATATRRGVAVAELCFRRTEAR